MPRALVVSFLEEQGALRKQAAAAAEGRKAKETEEPRESGAAAERKDEGVPSEGRVKPKQSGGGSTIQDLQRNLALLEELKRKAQRSATQGEGG